MTPVVVVGSIEDISVLAEEMKNVCRVDPDYIPAKASANAKEAMENANLPGVSELILNSGRTRVMAFPIPGRSFFCFVTISITLDHYVTPHRWNISVSLPNPNGEPLRVPDPLCDIFVKEFLGEDYREIPPLGAFKKVRQFVSDTEE